MRFNSGLPRLLLLPSCPSLWLNSGFLRFHVLSPTYQDFPTEKVHLEEPLVMPLPAGVSCSFLAPPLAPRLWARTHPAPRWRDQLGEDAPCQPPPQLMELGLKHGCLALRISFWPLYLAHLFIANRPLEKGLHFLRLVFDFSNRTVFRIPLFLLTRLFESMR